MSTSLVPQDSQLVTQVEEDSQFTKYKGGASFLKRLQFYSKGKSFRDGTNIPPGTYGIPDSDEVTQLGPEMDIIPLARGVKVIDLSNKSEPIVLHDSKNPEFQRIESLSGVKDSNCMSGVRYLVFERTTGDFYELFCHSKGLKKAADLMSGYLPRTLQDCAKRGLDESHAKDAEACTLGAKFVERKIYAWHEPTVTDCSTPFADLPTPEQVGEQIRKFVEVKDSDVERVADTEAPSRER